MPIPRRNFMQVFGISIGSLILARCQRTPTPTPTVPVITCYTVVPPTATATPQGLSVSARGKMRACWMRFEELARKTREARDAGGSDAGENTLGGQMTRDHRAALDALVAEGDVITQSVSDLIQEAYAAAVYHIWRLNAPLTCYEPALVDYAPADAASLVSQAEALEGIAAGTPVAAETLAKIRAALEHDLAFYALTDAEVQALYDQLTAEYNNGGEGIPSFEELALTLTREIKAAAQFLLDVLAGK
jgi:hypothetical protein